MIWLKKLSIKTKFVVPLAAGAYWVGVYAETIWHVMQRLF